VVILTGPLMFGPSTYSTPVGLGPVTENGSRSQLRAPREKCYDSRSLAKPS
jgi:hypothetical protein